MHNYEYIEVKKSPIHGFGVFARCQIPKGTRLAYFYGIPMKPKDIMLKYGNYRFTYRRPFQSTWICSRYTPNLINFVNSVGFGKSKGMKANVILKNRWLIPTRDIKVGEELLLEYPKGYWKHGDD